jgi:uncharacterized SAM-binding protein YcdF (DUF218 family)
MRKLSVIGVTCLLVCAIFSGWFLVINQPQKADVILVLAGETDSRPARALELLHQQYASRIILNVPARAKLYQWMQTDLARQYVQGLPDGRAVTICPIYGFSTKDEAKESKACLAQGPSSRVLLVTSEFHTRRTLSIFKKEVPGHEYSVAAAFNPSQFGVKWWEHREWAKTNLGEWTRLSWWEAVDRWR